MPPAHQNPYSIISDRHLAKHSEHPPQNLPLFDFGNYLGLGSWAAQSLGGSEIGVVAGGPASEEAKSLSPTLASVHCSAQVIRATPRVTTPRQTKRQKSVRQPSHHTRGKTHAHQRHDPRKQKQKKPSMGYCSHRREKLPPPSFSTPAPTDRCHCRQCRGCRRGGKLQRRLPQPTSHYHHPHSPLTHWEWRCRGVGDGDAGSRQQ
jgi:hypothetical protein